MALLISMQDRTINAQSCAVYEGLQLQGSDEFLTRVGDT